MACWRGQIVLYPVLILSAVLFFLMPQTAFSRETQDSLPYISGDGFRNFADFVYDLKADSDSSRFILAHAKSGDVIFVQADRLGSFFSKVHRHIQVSYILLTHNSDDSIPGPYLRFLDDEKLIKWFGQNVEGAYHPKLIPIPIGVGNTEFHYGNVEALLEAEESVHTTDKTIFLYLNVTLTGRHPEREKVYHLFRKKHFCTHVPSKDFRGYLADIAASEFVLSPRGIGLDCHRTWEAMLLKAVPVIISSASDPLYEHLPVIIVDQWEEVTEEFLIQKRQTMKLLNYHLEKLMHRTGLS